MLKDLDMVKSKNICISTKRTHTKRLKMCENVFCPNGFFLFPFTPTSSLLVCLVIGGGTNMSTTIIKLEEDLKSCFHQMEPDL